MELEIKNIREKALLTQQEFAKELDVSYSVVQKWEQNKLKPSLRYKRRIVEFCKKNGIEA